MEVFREEPAEEVKRLQRCMNDLSSVLAMPALWSGGDAAQIAQVLVDVLLDMLRLDFIYVRINEPLADMPLELARVAASGASTEPLPELRGALEACLGKDPRDWPPTIEYPPANGEVSIVPCRLGLHDELGTLVAGARGADFPRQADRLLLNVAANQAAMALQEVLLRSKQRRIGHEAALRDTELSARQILDSIPALVLVTTPFGEIADGNQRVLEYLGGTLDDLKNWRVDNPVHPDDRAVVEAFEHSIATGEPYDSEHRLRRFDGEYRWFQARGLPLRDAAGEILRWHVLLIDIEDRKLAQEELRRSERDARLIVDSIPAYVAVLGATGEVQQINRRMSDFLGDRVVTPGRWGLHDTIPSGELPGVRAALDRLLETGQAFEMEHRLRRFDGEYRWFQARGVPLLDANGHVVTSYLAFADIHERKKAEEALLRSAALLSQAQRISATGSFSWWLDTDEIEFSDELYRLFELPPKSTVNLPYLVQLVHPEDRPIQHASFQHMKSGGDEFVDEIRLRFPDGRIKYIRTFGKVMPHPNGRRECVGALQDVTQRQLSIEALDKARSELAHVNRSMSLGALTASIAHEVSQPLSGIVTNAGTCLRFLTADPPNVAGALETAHRTIRDSKRAEAIITRLRALFGRKAATTETVDLNDAAREVISLLSRDLQRNGVMLQMELADTDGPVLVTGDRVQLQQVIVNLVRNASEAMVEVHDRPRRLVVRTAREPADSVRLSVRDDGVGLEAASLEKVFDPFFTTKTDSMGFGLSVSRLIIERHHGRLWAEANQGHGATFTFSIPRWRPDSRTAQALGLNRGRPLRSSVRM